ncbi:MAG: tautomerase family protein [Syntrophomonas sp.]
MPIVTVQMTSGRDSNVKRKLADEITRLLVVNLDVEPEWVTVLFQELDRENWATGGQLHSERFGPGCGRQGVK